MKHALPPLDSLKVFESAARHLSFSQAADELCISKGAVSYQIQKIEQSIDTALFKRSTRQVYLTEAGQKLFLTTGRLFEELGQTLGQLSPGEHEHDVTIGATTYVAMRWLSPRIARFSVQHPDVSMVFQHSVNSEDFKPGDVDIAIRWGACNGKRDASRLLELPMPLYPVCSPALLQKLCLQECPGDIDRRFFNEPPFNSVVLLCEDRPMDLWQAWYGEAQPALSNPRRVVADANVRTQAAIDGQGWTMADALMQAEMKRGELVAPFQHRLSGYGYQLLVSPGRYISRKTRGLIDWLINYAEDARAD